MAVSSSTFSPLQVHSGFFCKALNPSCSLPCCCRATCRLLLLARRSLRLYPRTQVLPIAHDEQVSSVLAVDEFKEDEYLVLLTQVR